MAAGRRPGAIQFCAGGIFHCHLPTCTISRGRPWEDVRCDVGGHPTSMTDAWSCGTYVLLQQDFLVFSQRDELRWCRSVVRLAARPFACRLRAPLFAVLCSAIPQPNAVAWLPTPRGRLHFPADLDQDLSRADHRFADCPHRLRTRGRVRMGRQDLSRERR